MKFVLLSLLVAYGYHMPDHDQCEQLKYSLEIIHTTNGLNNGKINVEIIKSQSEVTAYLYAESRANNKLGVKISKLVALPAGKYKLVLQNTECSIVEKNLIIE